MQNTLAQVDTKVCFIIGAGHSGSTLLGFILGSHRDGFYCGEAAKTRYLKDDSKILVKRVCKICGANCPVWKNIWIDETKNLYGQIATKMQRSLIIDSSKNTDWIQHQLSLLEQTSVRPFLLFLQRDGRAVINSRIRKYPNKESIELIKNWIKQINLTNILFSEFSQKKLKISYEELATNTASTVQRICRFLEIDYQPEMLSYAQHEHHVLGGNNGTQFLIAQAQREKISSPFVQLHEQNRHYYESRGSEITLDLRWKQELDPAIERLFEEMAGNMNQELKWGA
jgi:hypothetical protein